MQELAQRPAQRPLQLAERAAVSNDSSSWSTTEIAAGAALSAAALGLAIAARKPMIGAIRSGIGMLSAEAKAVVPELKLVGADASAIAGSAKSSDVVTKTPFSALREPFQENGRLVSGTHTLSWDELASSFGATRERQVLLERFKPIAQDLKAAKIESVEIGGSFASTKAAPKDIDFAWNNQQTGFSARRLRWRQPDLMTAETDALQYRGLHNVNGATGSHYPDALQFLRKVKIEPKVEVDIGKISSHADMVELGKLRQQARLDAARLEEEMRQAGTLYRNGVLSLDLKTLRL